MKIREQAFEWIIKRAKGTEFDLGDLYSHIRARFPQECERSGLTPDGKEEKWRKDTRWALQDSKKRRLIVHTGSARSGRWKPV